MSKEENPVDEIANCKIHFDNASATMHLSWKSPVRKNTAAIYGDKGLLLFNDNHLIIENQDVDSSNYETTRDLLRPSHVDYVILQKFGGFADYRGSGRFSGRITAGFVMAGAVAKQILDKNNINPDRNKMVEKIAKNG